MDLAASTPSQCVPTHAWVAAITSVLDAAYALDERERAGVAVVTTRLFDAVDADTTPITPEPDGSADAWRPLLVDAVVSAAAWSDALSSLVAGTYQDLSEPQCMEMRRAFRALLIGLRADTREAARVPPAVLRSAVHLYV